MHGWPYDIHSFEEVTPLPRGSGTTRFLSDNTFRNGEQAALALDGAPHPDPSSYANKFSGWYSHRTITGGIGHNLPQEAPDAFADAILEIGGAA